MPYLYEQNRRPSVDEMYGDYRIGRRILGDQQGFIDLYPEVTGAELDELRRRYARDQIDAARRHSGAAAPAAADALYGDYVIARGALRNFTLFLDLYPRVSEAQLGELGQRFDADPVAQELLRTARAGDDRPSFEQMYGDYAVARGQIGNLDLFYPMYPDVTQPELDAMARRFEREEAEIMARLAGLSGSAGTV